MSNFFEHTPQPLSNTNQVEKLASEVEEAFNKVEDKLFEDNSKSASIQSSIGDLDNSYIKEYVPNNGWILNYTQPLYFPKNSQEASLDLMPSIAISDLNSISVTNLTNPSKNYTYKLDGTLSNENEFTFVGRKVIFGKAPLDSETLNITYKGYNTTIPQEDNGWAFELKYNVLQVKLPDNSIMKEFKSTSNGVEYTIIGYDFKSLCSETLSGIIDNSPTDLGKYVAIYSEDERIEITDVNITNSNVTFISESVFNKDKLKIYVANSSLSTLIGCLYKLFYTHDHGVNGGNLVDHNSLLGLYKNIDSLNNYPNIEYHSTDKVNYDHPQYFNREGYVEDSSVYNNSILGDILLASSSTSNRRNNLDSNSVKLIFGEYNSGHRLYFNSADDCLWLDSISRDGVRLAVPKDKKALSINEHSFVDTTYKTSETNNSLKITLKSDKEEELGVLRLTRKLVNPLDNSVIEDDKAFLLSHKAEHDLTVIKEQITIENDAKLSFGDLGAIYFEMRNDGLHLTTEDPTNITNVTKIIFDIPVQISSLVVDHIDAKEIHLSPEQSIVFGGDHKSNDGRVYYDNTNLVVDSKTALVFKNNGRTTGISLANKNFIYSATPQGFPVDSSVDTLDLFVETKRNTYFLQSGYTYVPGVTSLTDVPKSDIYARELNGLNFKVAYKDGSDLNGVTLSNNSRIYAQKDEQDNISIFLHGPNVISTTSYSNTNGNSPIISYGKFTGKIFTAIGDENTDAGFYGNIIVPQNQRITVNGLAEFNNELTFRKPVFVKSTLTVDKLDVDDTTTRVLKVTEKADYKDITADNVEVLTELKFSYMKQMNHVMNSTWEGTVQFNNNIYMPNSINHFIIGNRSIEDTRQTSGLLLRNNEVRLGTNGQVIAGKVIASKGTPTGNGDNAVGFAFSTTNGRPDGDTGMFAEGDEEAQNGSDLVFRTDGVEVGRLQKEKFDLNSLSIAGKEKILVTVDMLLELIRDRDAEQLNVIYPIGTIYENSIDNRNPSIILNWSSSVWRRHGVGRVTIAASGSGVGEQIEDGLLPPPNLSLDVLGNKVGKFQVGLEEQHGPKHGHFAVADKDSDEITRGTGPMLQGRARDGKMGYNLWSGELKGQGQFPTFTSGEGVPHENMQPSITTGRWERIG